MGWRQSRLLQQVWTSNRLWPRYTSLKLVPEKALECNDSSQEVTIQCAQEKTVRIKDYFAFIIQDHITAERAAMARPTDAEPLVIKDNTTIVMDCGASSSSTGSQLNTKEISEKVTRLEMADGAETMEATHHCMKTYFVRNRMGETKPITVPALYVRGLPQDLLGGKSLTRQNIRVILDDDADIGGI